MDKKFIGALIIVALILGGVFWFSSNKEAEAPATGGQPTTHTQGKGTSNVTLVEYGDFECSACLQYYPALKQVKEKYGDKITFQFRHYPLPSLHPNAFAAHRAAEAAAKQGKFWEMHDILYENQQGWSAASGVTSSQAISLFEGYAQQLNLDIEQFKKDFKGSEVNAIINADIKEGETFNATSTPTFVLNGKKLEENPRPTLESFSEIIDKAIADQNKED